jgi:hypothetical protein
MVYDIQDYWVFGLCPSSGILRNRTTQRFGNWICFRPQVRGQETSTHLGPLERVQWLRLALSNGANWVGVSCPHTWGRKHIQFPKRYLLFLEYRKIDKVQKLSSPEFKFFEMPPSSHAFVRMISVAVPFKALNLFWVKVGLNHWMCFSW